MVNKYAYLLSLQTLEYEIRLLNDYSKECSDCFELLRTKLDDLCQFMVSDENERLWRQLERYEEIRLHGEQLHQTSIQALCDVEKYQSLCALEKNLNISEYMAALANSISEEVKYFAIDHRSKVLFIGSGAFPLSALTIVKETGADVVCLDIDDEAVYLGGRVAESAGLQSKIRFSGDRLRNLPFVQEATHVMVASLVGNKLEILEDLKPVVKPDARIIVRYGNGLKSILLGQVFLTKAFTHENAIVVQAIGYSGIAVSALFDFLLWGLAPDPITVAGGVMILAGCAVLSKPGSRSKDD